MIRNLNRLYWIAYLSVIYGLFWLLHHVFAVRMDNAAIAAFSSVALVLFMAHLGFNASGFALSYSVRQLPQVKGLTLPFQYDPKEPPVTTMSTWSWIKALFNESVGSLKLITLLQPWAPSPEGIEVAGKAWRKQKPLPVLLVHGYLCNAAMWSSTRALLNEADVSSHAITLEPAIGSIRRYSKAINTAIDDLLAATGAPQVKIIAHSMGGVAVRYHAIEFGHHRIAGLMTLGSPHYGTALSSLGVGKNVKQMAWGSYFVKKLRENPIDQEFQHKVWSVWSPQDNIVCPPWSSKLEFGRNTMVPGCGHVSLVSDPITERLIQEWLAEDMQAYPLAENRA